MALLNIAPTKSNLLNLRRQLAAAEEGYDLLEQKRQLLIFELVSRILRARELEERAAVGLQRAFSALQLATLDMGGAALDRAALAIVMNHQLEITTQHLMGLHLPQVAATIDLPRMQFGVGGTSASSDSVIKNWVEILPTLAELSVLQNAVIALSQALRKTQRRCNALNKLFIPSYRETITYIASALEERDREMFATMKIVRRQLDEGRSSL